MNDYLLRWVCLQLAFQNCDWDASTWEVIEEAERIRKRK